MTVTSNVFCCYWWQGWRQHSWLLLPTFSVVTGDKRWRQQSLLLLQTFSVVTGDKVGSNSHDCYFQRFLFLLNSQGWKVTLMTVISNVFCFYWWQDLNNEWYFSTTRCSNVVTTNKRKQGLINSHDVTSNVFSCYWWQGWRQHSWLLLPTLLLLLTREYVGDNSHDCYLEPFLPVTGDNEFELTVMTITSNVCLLLLVTRLETTVMTVTSNRMSHSYWWQGWKVTAMTVNFNVCLL